jgi:eukaryotic-like serine/threonine-protein kinase
VRSDTPVGVVVRQDPLPGKKVEKASTVKLFVSSGPGLTTVPDVTNMTQAKAVKKLKAAGLFATIHDESATTVPSGRVIRTDPTPLNQVTRGSRVDVYVSTGPELVTVPAVVGKQKADAQAALQDAGLKVTVHELDSKVTKGQVVSQDPGGGSRVARDTRVTITVSKGIQRVEVTDVKDYTRDEAVALLRSDGFAVRVVEIDGTEQQQRRVIRQSPSAGSKRDKGSTVTIYVGKRCSPSGALSTTPNNLPPCQ